MSIHPQALFGSIALLIGSGMLVQSLEYKPGFGAKQVAWALHSALVGAVVAPICFMGEYCEQCESQSFPNLL